MRRRLLPLVVLAMGLAQPAALNAASSGPACRPRVTTITRTQGPVDAVLPLPRGAAVLLVGQARGLPRFLGHASLVLVHTHPFRVRGHVPLPAYTVPPGLAVLDGGKSVAVVIDDRVLVVDAATGRLVHRLTLDMQAVGWPAAVSAVGNQLYVAGQPNSASAPAARLEALELARKGSPPRLLWQTSLGLTHAGIWLGMAGSEMLAGYLPDSHDLLGLIATWNTRNGALLGSYAVPGPAVAADPILHRLYGSAGSHVYARTLARGGALMEQTGTAPVTAAPRRGLVLFAREGQLVAASARTLHPIGTARLSGLRSLGSVNGSSTALAGLSTGLAGIDLGSCRAR